jgi:hypothetical protein
MFELSWQQFSRQPGIAKLPINEQIRQFQFAQQRIIQQQQYIANTMVAGSGPTTVDPSINLYVDGDYIEPDYFE